mmetsp:Transcript_21338/g.65069  ORF Transcript_21338/g.65069 Transcript_21338/m.65069 type:complete len:219 (+) Transcript_21338:241-897(+)
MPAMRLLLLPLLLGGTGALRVPASRRGFLGALAAPVLGGAVFGAAEPALAAYGASPKMNVKDEQIVNERGSAVEGGGSASVFDEEAKAREQKAKVEAEWTKIRGVVDKALERGKQSDLLAAKDILALNMGNIKSRMRDVSRIGVGGEIMEKEEGSGLSKFDYNTGKFSLKELVQKPEDVFAAVNETYFYIGRKDVESARVQWAKAVTAYEEWIKLVPF